MSIENKKSIVRNLLKSEIIPSFKPMRYPQAYKFYEDHMKLFWTKDEIPLGQDVIDWNTKATESDKKIITTFLRIFTQSDVQVGRGYDLEIRVFKPTEVSMMLRSFADRECTHIDSYSLFTDTLGFAETFYDEWRDFDTMSNKMVFMEKARVKAFDKYIEEVATQKAYYREEDIKAIADKNFRKDLARMVAVYGGLVEGVALFSSFALLLNYSRQGMFNGLATIVEWSLRDEDLHSLAQSWLFRTLINENKDIWDDELKRDIYASAREVIDLEDKFIDFAYDNSDIKGLPKEDLKAYIRYMADRRLKQLGLKPNWKIETNPLEWVDDILSVTPLTNFFDSRVTDYAKNATTGNWSDVRASLEDYK